MNRMNPTLALPPRIDVPAVAAAAEAYSNLFAEYGSTADGLRSLEERRHLAVEADRAAYADAIRNGKPDPGQKAVLKLDEQMLTTRRRTEALAVAVTAAEADLRSAVAAAKPEWSAEIARQAAAARESFTATVEALADATARLVEVNGIAAWLNRFPAEHLIFKPGGPTRVPGLRAPSSEDYLLSVVLGALAEVANPPAAPPPSPGPFTLVGDTAA